MIIIKNDDPPSSLWVVDEENFCSLLKFTLNSRKYVLKFRKGNLNWSLKKKFNCFLATEKAKAGSRPRQDRNAEFKLNKETFGVAGNRGGRGGYYNRRGYNNYNNGGGYRGNQGQGGQYRGGRGGGQYRGGYQNNRGGGEGGKAIIFYLNLLHFKRLIWWNFWNVKILKKQITPF